MAPWAAHDARPRAAAERSAGAQLCLAVARGPGTGQVSSHAHGAGRSSSCSQWERQRTEHRGKSSWLPGGCGCRVFLPLTLLSSHRPGAAWSGRAKAEAAAWEARGFVCFAWRGQGAGGCAWPVSPESPEPSMLPVRQIWCRRVLACCSPGRVGGPWLSAVAGSSLLPQHIWSWTLGPAAPLLAELLSSRQGWWAGWVLAVFPWQGACPMLSGNPRGQTARASQLLFSCCPLSW